MDILLIEDDEATRDHVAACLSAQGHVVTSAASGNQGLNYALQNPYGAIVVDRILPAMDGLSVVKTLRDRGNHTPILILSAMSGIEDRVEGLEAGADDYLVKPFAAPELAARVKALARRTSILKTCIVGSCLCLDLVTQTATQNGKALELEPIQFRLLEYMMRNAEQVLTRAMLLQQVWGLNFDPRTNVIETHMSRLRARLNRSFRCDVIQTIRGAGYLFSTAPEHCEASNSACR